MRCDLHFLHLSVVNLSREQNTDIKMRVRMLTRQQLSSLNTKLSNGRCPMRVSARGFSASGGEVQRRSYSPQQLKEDLNYCVNLLRERDREGFCKFVEVLGTTLFITV